MNACADVTDTVGDSDGIVLCHWPRGRDTGRLRRTLFWCLRAVDRLPAIPPGGDSSGRCSGSVGHIRTGLVLRNAWGWG